MLLSLLPKFLHAAAKAFLIPATAFISRLFAYRLIDNGCRQTKVFSKECVNFLQMRNCRAVSNLKDEPAVFIAALTLSAFKAHNISKMLLDGCEPLLFEFIAKRAKITFANLMKIFPHRGLPKIIAKILYAVTQRAVKILVHIRIVRGFANHCLYFVRRTHIIPFNRLFNPFSGTEK